MPHAGLARFAVGDDPEAIYAAMRDGRLRVRAPQGAWGPGRSSSQRLSDSMTQAGLP